MLTRTDATAAPGNQQPLSSGGDVSSVLGVRDGGDCTAPLGGDGVTDQTPSSSETRSTYSCRKHTYFCAARAAARANAPGGESLCGSQALPVESGVSGDAASLAALDDSPPSPRLPR